MALLDNLNIRHEDVVLIDAGLSSTVVHINGTKFVAKIPAPGSQDDIDIEKAVYERLQDHPQILKYHGQESLEHLDIHGALILDYHRKMNLLHCLHDFSQHPQHKLWPLQAVTAVSFIHSRGIIHGDIGLHNYLLTDEGNIVLCDFAGSGIDGLPPSVSASGRYRNPLLNSYYPHETDDVFALGTVLYELSLGQRLYQDKSNNEIEQCFRNKHFPDLSRIEAPLSEVIAKCWRGEGYTAIDALHRLQGQIPVQDPDRAVRTRYRAYNLGLCSIAAAAFFLAYWRRRVHQH